MEEVELHGGGCTEVVVQMGLHGGTMQKVDWLMWIRISRSRHILRCYTSFGWLIVPELYRSIIVYPWLKLIAPGNHWFSG